MDSQLTLRHTQDLLNAANSIDECWQILSDTSRTLGLTEVQFKVNGSFYSEKFNNHARDCWNFDVPLPGTAYAKFAVPFQSKVQPMTIAPFADVVRTTLSAKLPTLLRTKTKGSADIAALLAALQPCTEQQNECICSTPASDRLG